MYIEINNYIKNNRKLYALVELVSMLLKADLIIKTGARKSKPKVIQLPITYKCNSRCVMCNVWKMDYSNEMDVAEFATYMQDELFTDVISVGINGGEPSLVRALPSFAREILKLPSIKSLNIISHGFNKKLLLQSLEEIYKCCQNDGVSFHVSVSLDGVQSVHDEVRGIPGAFKKTMATVDEIVSHQDKYCDSIDLGCTVVKQNLAHLVELNEYINQKGLKIKYRLGIDNKRIESDKLRDQYSVIYSSLTQSAAEFFHWQYKSAISISDKFKYYAIFCWLTAPKKKRLLGCMWKDEGVTLDSRGSLYYCAVVSDEIGSLRKQSGGDIFFSHKNINYRKNIVKNNCDNCIHDYVGNPYLWDVLNFISYTFKNKLAMLLYKFRLQVRLI